MERNYIRILVFVCAAQAVITLTSVAGTFWLLSQFLYRLMGHS